MMTIGSNNNHSSHHASPWDFMTTNTASSSSAEIDTTGVTSSLDPIFQAQSPPNEFSHLSVSDILSTYKHDTDLMKHVLAAKAQEDRRKTAEEFRQMEEARLRFRFNDFDMEDYQKTDYPSTEKKDPSTSAYSHQNNSHIYAESSLQAGKRYDQHDNSPHLDLLLSSPPSILMDQDMPSIYMGNQHQGQSTGSIPMLEAPVVPSHDFHLNVPTTSYALPSSKSPSTVNTSHFMSPSPNIGYSEMDLKSTSSSCSSSIASYSYMADTSSSPPVKNSNSGEANSNKDSGTKAGKKKAISSSTTSKHRRKPSSTTTIMPGFSSSTHVLRWAAPKKKRPPPPPMVNVNQEPQVPLDHDVVMNALRSKLMRTNSKTSSSDSIASSSSPPPVSSSSSSPPPPPANSTHEMKSPTPPPPPPRSPPVDTQPTTGILFLDLKSKSNRRKKTI